MNNTLNDYDYENLSHDELVAIMRYELSRTDERILLNLPTALFDEIINRMISLKAQVDDFGCEIDRQRDEIDELHNELATDAGDNDHFDFDEVQVRQDRARDDDLRRFLDRLEEDANEIGGDTGARIREAVGMIHATLP